MKLALDSGGVVAAWVANLIPYVGEQGFGPNEALAVVSAGDRIMAGGGVDE